MSDLIGSIEHSGAGCAPDEDQPQRGTDSLSKPLCGKYVFVGFKTLRLPIHDGDAVKHVLWRWALGLFKQKQYEILGAWPAQVALARVTQDLHERGIEQMKAISAEGGLDSTSQYPGAAPWPSAEGGLDASSPNAAHVFAPRRRAALQSAAATAERLQTSFTRAIKRRAPFADDAAAAAFLAHTLQHADRRFYQA